MATPQASAISLSLQALASMISDRLTLAAGEPVGFVLLVSADETAQYVANVSRAEGLELIKNLLAHWKAGRADIPAHFNPNLQRRP